MVQARWNGAVTMMLAGVCSCSAAFSALSSSARAGLLSVKIAMAEQVDRSKLMRMGYPFLIRTSDPLLTALEALSPVAGLLCSFIARYNIS